MPSGNIRIVSKNNSGIKDNKKEKVCFVICPIGSEGSEIREWSDTLLEFIIKPIVETKYGYSVLRADQIPSPGIITKQIIEYLINSDLVIADLSFKNPNVFYELAVRHAARKQYIQMIKKGEDIPFDIGGNRTISFDINIKYAEKAKGELENQIKTIEDGKFEIENPIGSAIDLISIKQTGNTEQITNVSILQNLEELNSKIYNLEKNLKVNGKLSNLDLLEKLYEDTPISSKKIENKINVVRAEMEEVQTIISTLHQKILKGKLEKLPKRDMSNLEETLQNQQNRLRNLETKYLVLLKEQ